MRTLIVALFTLALAGCAATSAATSTTAGADTPLVVHGDVMCGFAEYGAFGYDDSDVEITDRLWTIHAPDQTVYAAPGVCWIKAD